MGAIDRGTLIYASMGTVQTGLANVFYTIAAAATKRKGFQLVLSVGNTLDPEQIGPVPSNAIIVKHAPQLELLKQASVCVTHAGLNTVLEALAQGVPQVAIPVANDQPGVAAVAIATEGVGATAEVAPDPPKRIAPKIARSMITAPPTIAPIINLRFGGGPAAGGGGNADGVEAAGDDIDTLVGRPAAVMFSLSAFQNA